MLFPLGLSQPRPAAQLLCADRRCLRLRLPVDCLLGLHLPRLRVAARLPLAAPALRHPTFTAKLAAQCLLAALGQMLPANPLRASLITSRSVLKVILLEPQIAGIPL
jgi:hypothetical protein